MRVCEAFFAGAKTFNGVKVRAIESETAIKSGFQELNSSSWRGALSAQSKKSDSSSKTMPRAEGSPLRKT